MHILLRRNNFMMDHISIKDNFLMMPIWDVNVACTSIMENAKHTVFVYEFLKQIFLRDLI